VTAPSRIFSFVGVVRQNSFISTTNCSRASLAYTRTCCKTTIIRITLCPARTRPRPTADLCRSPTQVPVARLPSSASPAYHSPTSLAYTRSCCKIAIIRITLCTARTRPRPTAHSCRSPTLVPIARLPSSVSPSYSSPTSLLGIGEDHDPTPVLSVASQRPPVPSQGRRILRRCNGWVRRDSR
jgi:hypothetical protein